jgi:hypothetical protein
MSGFVGRKVRATSVFAVVFTVTGGGIVTDATSLSVVGTAGDSSGGGGTNVLQIEFAMVYTLNKNPQQILH